MVHPFEKLSTASLRTVYWLFLVLTIAVAIGLGELAKYTPDGQASCETPSKVPTIDFEFAKTPDDWSTLAKAAGTNGLNALRVQTHWDYLFLVVYSTLLAAAVIGVSRGCSLGWIARWLAWAQWIAALMDAVENAGLLVNIAGPVSGTWTHISSTAALIKFVIIGIGIVYVFASLACSWRERE